MDYSVDYKGKIAVVHFNEDLGFEAVEELKAVLYRLADEQKQVVLDMSRVRQLNSRGLGVLTAASRHARKAGGDLVVARLSQSMNELFRVTHLDKILAICETEEEAVAYFNK